MKNKDAMFYKEMADIRWNLHSNAHSVPSP